MEVETCHHQSFYGINVSSVVPILFRKLAQSCDIDLLGNNLVLIKVPRLCDPK